MLDQHIGEAGPLHCPNQIDVEVGLHVVGADGPRPWLVPGVDRIASADEPAHVKHWSTSIKPAARAAIPMLGHSMEHAMPAAGRGTPRVFGFDPGDTCAARMLESGLMPSLARSTPAISHRRCAPGLMRRSDVWLPWFIPSCDTREPPPKNANGFERRNP